MVDAQTVGLLVTTTSVTVAAIYYVMTLRVQQKNMKTILDTRQISLIMQLSQLPRSYEGMKQYLEWMNMDWKDYDDFEKKYGSDNNPNNYALRESLNGYFNTMGLLLKRRLVEPEMLFDYNG